MSFHLPLYIHARSAFQKLSVARLAFVLALLNHRAPSREPDNLRVAINSRDITSTLKDFYDKAAFSAAVP